MRAEGLPPLALYVHIPWCERKCPYCDFNSHEHFDTSLQAPYVDALLADLESQLSFVEGRNLTSIFIGGGTPSLFEAPYIGGLLDGIDQRLGIPSTIEITLESNPGSAESARYQGYRAAGVNRLSIGVQSFAPTALSRLGRVHDAGQAIRACELAVAAGFARFNIDLMHGLPEQTPEQAKQDLQQALALGARHISWYQLTIEPNTAFYRAPPILPLEDALGAIQDRGEAALAAGGLQRYEVSAFAVPGEESRHNLNYWRFGDYLGIGAGAHGKVSVGQGEQWHVQRFQRTRAPKDYLQAAAPSSTGVRQFAPPRCQPVPPEDLLGEFMMNALRLVDGVTVADFLQHTRLPWSALTPPLARAQALGLMVEDPDRLAPTELGLRFMNDVVGMFFDD